MADLDPGKVGASGVDPVTGSPLSQEVRNALIKKSVIDKSVFKNELSEYDKKREKVDTENLNVVKSQQQALSGFNSNIQALRTDIGKLGTGLANIALLLRQDNEQEISQTKAEQEKERKLTEQQIRIGKESEIEQKIQNAVAAPVEKLTPKISNLFGNIGRALEILFGGWLTIQTVKLIQAAENGNTELFNKIKSNILKNLGILLGGIIAIKTGFSLVKKTIGSIASGLVKLLIVKPLAAASRLLPGRSVKPRAKPGGGTGSGLFGLVGKVFTGISGVFNFLNGENVDAALAAISIMPATGKVGFALKAAAGLAFGIDEVMEMLDKNFTGADPKLLAQKKKELEDEKRRQEDEKRKSSTSSPKPAPTPPAPPAAQPQTPMMGDNKKEGVEANPNSGAKIQSSTSSTEATSTPSTTLVMSPPSQTTMESASFGVDQSGLTGPASPLPNVAAQVTPPPKPPTQVGQLPEPQASVTVINSPNGTNQQGNIPATSGSLTDVPLIPSSNPDNFYTLYSQLNYNVVM